MYSRKHYLGVFEEAKDALAAININVNAAATGFQTSTNENGSLELIFDWLGERCRIDAATYDIFRESGRVLPLQMRIITLHYLKNSASVRLKGDLIPLKRLPGLESYGPTISRRSDAILARRFGDKPELFFPTMEKLGGVKMDIGDASARFMPLPNLPVVMVINAEEPGLPAEANVLYDSSAPSLLHLEDLVVLAEILCHKLVNTALMFM